MTQLLPSTTYRIRRDLRHWVYGAMGDDDGGAPA
jgi:hypothetical protein